MGDSSFTKYLARFIVLSFCIVCFIAVAFDQTRSYFERKTSTISTMIRKTNVTFPIMVFCPKLTNGNSRFHFNPYGTKDEYDRNSANLSVSLRAISR